MKSLLYIFIVIGIMLFSAFIQLSKPYEQKPSTVAGVLFNLGEPKPVHFIANLDQEKIKIGKELFLYGTSTHPDGGQSNRISKHYVCSSCHNNVKEDPSLANQNPVARLTFAKEKNIPFLQGTTMYGVVNRKTWYNGDYKEKYGDLVIPARDTLANAIQLCAKECSQGRLLEDWELEAFLHYFWSIQLMLEDLSLSKEENELIKQQADTAMTVLKSKFVSVAEATFIPALSPEERTYGKTGDADLGKLIYNQSCLHCHDPKARITNLKLEDNKLSHQLLKSMLKKTSELSVYEIVRRGTYPIIGYKPYMPHYTQERLTNQQIEDLVAYINQQSN